MDMGSWEEEYKVGMSSEWNMGYTGGQETMRDAIMKALACCYEDLLQKAVRGKKT